MIRRFDVELQSSQLFLHNLGSIPCREFSWMVRKVATNRPRCVLSRYSLNVYTRRVLGLKILVHCPSENERPNRRWKCSWFSTSVNNFRSRFVFYLLQIFLETFKNNVKTVKVAIECPKRRASKVILMGSFSVCSSDAWKKQVLQQRGRGVRKRYCCAFHKNKVHVHFWRHLYLNETQ
jgi:hypothetical protein